MTNSIVLKYGFFSGTEGNKLDMDKRHKIHREQALIEAAAIGDCEKLTKLLNLFDISADAEAYNELLFSNIPSKNYVTPLQFAAANGHDKCVQILINHGADINAFDVRSLHVAAEKSNYLFLKALLDAGVDCYVRTKYSKHYRAVPRLFGTNPLHLAAANNHVDCVKKLIQYGADLNIVDELGHTSLYIAAQAGFDECILAHQNRDILSLPSPGESHTPLHYAVAHEMVDRVKQLLYLGSDVNHINHLGYSPLHLALTSSLEESSKKMEILKLLVLEGYNTDINLPDATGSTPLHSVCFTETDNSSMLVRIRRPEKVKFLISYGADVNIKNSRGCTLLELELKSYRENYDVLNYLVNSLLGLPPLKSLNDLKHQDILDEHCASPPNVISVAQIHRNRKKYSSRVLEKQLWYEKLASKPRTLQHHCRFVIRKFMGPMKIKHIRKLPIPKATPSYLLLETDE